MNAFAPGRRTDLLVATTVVEVGIDVPNATVMVIEDADRFGLAQLHQLRGRVGRGEHPGLCILFAEPTTEDGARRLEALTQTTDGFRLAELDLEIRGEGSILGLRQAGPTDLRFARLSRDRRELAAGAPRGAADASRRPPPDAARARAAARGPSSTGSPSCRGCSTREDRRRRPTADGRLVAPRGAQTRPTARPGSRGAVLDHRPGRGPRRARPLRRVGRARLEALSRGAASATFVERSAPAIAAIRANAAMIEDLARVRIVAADWRSALRAERAAGRVFGLCLIDPPYSLLPRIAGRLGPALQPVLAAGATVVIEHAAEAAAGRAPSGLAITARAPIGPTATRRIAIMRIGESA